MDDIFLQSAMTEMEKCEERSESGRVIYRFKMDVSYFVPEVMKCCTRLATLTCSLLRANVDSVIPTSDERASLLEVESRLATGEFVDMANTSFSGGMELKGSRGVLRMAVSV